MDPVNAWESLSYFDGILFTVWLGLSHDSLYNHYKTNFAMMQHHGYSLTELDNMVPWEREIYVALLKNYIEEENERLKQQK